MTTNPIFSRCSLGKGRWFWVVYHSLEALCQGNDAIATGYATSAEEAEEAALIAVPNAQYFNASMAAHHHRDRCIQRRAAKRCSNGTKAVNQEVLYSDWLDDYSNEWRSIPHLVVKKTKKLVFVEKDGYNPDPWDRRTYAVSRGELEAQGEVWSHRARTHFYITPRSERWKPWASPEWTVLGIKAGASKQEIKAAYRRLAREHHPDCGGDPGKFKEVQEAYERALAG